MIHCMLETNPLYNIYGQTSNISRTLVGNKIVDYSEEVGVSPVGAADIFILDVTPGFKGLCIDNWKTRRESFKICDFVRLLLDILRYMLYVWIWYIDINIQVASIYGWWNCACISM